MNCVPSTETITLRHINYLPGPQKKGGGIKFEYLSSQQTDYSQTFTQSSIYKWGEVVTILWS